MKIAFRDMLVNGKFTGFQEVYNTWTHETVTTHISDSLFYSFILFEKVDVDKIKRIFCADFRAKMFIEDLEKRLVQLAERRHGVDTCIFGEEIEEECFSCIAHKRKVEKVKRLIELLENT